MRTSTGLTLGHDILVAAVGSIGDSCAGRPMDPGRAYARRDYAGVKLRWTWRNGRLAAHPDLRVAGWSACLAVPKNGEPEGGGVVPMLGGPAVVPCEPSRTEPCERSNRKIKLAEYV